ncbi:MAG TPA: hypothetical protein VNA13_01430 [Xanthomonadales bacterium]|nr:hypothetical protein [Xanthomonadales bacterium]
MLELPIQCIFMQVQRIGGYLILLKWALLALEAAAFTPLSGAKNSEMSYRGIPRKLIGEGVKSPDQRMKEFS